MEELLEIARRVQESAFFLQRDERDSSQTNKPTRIRKSDPKPSGSTRKPVPASPPKGPPKGPLNKSTTCFNCKKTGHVANHCPSKPKPSRTARVAQESEEPGRVPRAFNTQEDNTESSQDNNEASPASDASDNESTQDSLYKSLPDSDGDTSLADWAAVAHITELSDEDDEDIVIYKDQPDAKSRILLDWSEMTGYPSEEEMSRNVPGTMMEPNNKRETTLHVSQVACVRLVPDGDSEENPYSFRLEEDGKDQVAFRHRATKELRTEDGPKRNLRNPGIIEGFIRVGGIKAHVLLDCGSTLDMISANFAAIAKLEMFQLKKPIKLQMATSGSRSIINYGARAEIRIGNTRQERYFDVVNLDRYDAIFGTPFLKDNSVLLNFAGNGSFRLHGEWFPVGSEELKNKTPKVGEEAGSSSKNNKRGTERKPH
jgi:Retroviral aspartyl protease/Zinc knuckle